jgi:hypothetical protein
VYWTPDPIRHFTQSDRADPDSGLYHELAGHALDVTYGTGPYDRGEREIKAQELEFRFFNYWVPAIPRR